MNYIDRHVGARLRRERVAHGRNLREQAVLIGVREETLVLFETGLLRVGAADLFRCCLSLELEPSALFDDLMASFPPGFDRPGDYSDA